MKHFINVFIKKIRLYLLNFFDLVSFRLITTKFILDKPKFDYQPIPWLGINEAKIRGKGTLERWDEIQKHISAENYSLKDIGSCVGFFCISASEKFNLHSIGLEMDEVHLRLARRAVPNNLKNRCSFMNIELDPSNISMLPNTNVTLLLSVWHHWVFHYGIDEATMMLKKTWSSTERILFFESGEEDTVDEFNLPFPGSITASDWLFEYLSNNLEDSVVLKIGKFESGKYDHYENKEFNRTLYKVTKI